MTGSEQTIYYARVTEAMRVKPGGGNADEGEFIETVEVPVSRARDFVLDGNHVKPTGCAFAVMWFLRERQGLSLKETVERHGLHVCVVALGLSASAMAVAYLISKYAKG